MASAWQSVVSVHQSLVDNGDKRTDQWLLVYSPVPVALIFLTYLFVVWAGPRLMKHREALDLKGVLIVYNFSMVGLSGYMFYEFLVTSWLSNYSYLCQPVDYSNSPLAVRMAKACWWFFFSKVIELSDTLFFILRKKNSQLTFLHIYHHGPLMFNWWAGIKYVAGGQSCSVLHRAGQHLCSHCDVFLLRPGCPRPSHAEVSVVEAIPHVSAAAAVSAVRPALRLQPDHRLRLPRRHECGGGWLCPYPRRPLQ
ncbi:hypothetical protein FQN60_013383 [Etheostoma spectabile]|uniref:Elongation of very long chain fatty acids protein n=1 Tax=Etheostoma spectabile TaxID=54343 RepID=A0A5J5D5L8_9PERO|nr:hypothetical protein FQN60_013383 [Etheostoma spectabile]